MKGIGGTSEEKAEDEKEDKDGERRRGGRRGVLGEEEKGVNVRGIGEGWRI